VKYAFIQAHRTEFRLTSMCRVLKVHRSGFYAWLLEPLSPRAKANEALTAKIKEFYDQSMGIYGSPASSVICAKLGWLAARTAWRG
jgi:putative transposase